jgi:hypothetical protein
VILTIVDGDPAGEGRCTRLSAEIKRSRKKGGGSKITPALVRRTADQPRASLRPGLTGILRE